MKGYLSHLLRDLAGEPYVTVDVIIELSQGIVVIERSNPPFGWALPGGFVDKDESLETAVRREAMEETHLKLKDLRQFHTYSDPRRDPRFHTVDTVFIAQGVGVPRSGDDAKDLKIVPYKELLNAAYAFDHKDIIRQYLKQRKQAR
ncbi:MAG TPA: NUDIX hydrolase [Candidatus Omnitrophota bacterium]|nr:NUDIX hydrolase [Candidatus Omnitrophota bacterium]